MSDTTAGTQTDLFELLDEKPPQPVFTVYEMTKALGWPHKCGFCGGPGFLGGGACRWPDDDQIGIAYNYCQGCVDKHGHPHVGKWGNTPLRLVRASEYLA